jgi:hypothetical protein
MQALRLVLQQRQAAAAFALIQMGGLVGLGLAAAAALLVALVAQEPQVKAITAETLELPLSLVVVAVQARLATTEAGPLLARAVTDFSMLFPGQQLFMLAAAALLDACKMVRQVAQEAQAGAEEVRLEQMGLVWPVLQTLVVALVEEIIRAHQSRAGQVL